MAPRLLPFRFTLLLRIVKELFVDSAAPWP